MTERIPLYGEQTEAAARLARVFATTGCRTQLELAAILNVRQSSVSDAKRRGSIPPEWLIKLLYLRGINPSWIMDGIGPKFLTPSGDTADINYPHESFPPMRPCDTTIMRRVLCCFPARDLEHFNVEIVYNDEMLWACETKCSKTREFGVGGLCPPLSDKLKAKLL